MKKVLAIVLVLVMVLGLAACGSKGDNADKIPDTMTSKDGKYEVAFVTDIGQLKDKSFNQGTWDGVKLFAHGKNLSYKYYQPANGAEATDDDRYNAMKAAVDGGAKVVVCAGFLQAAALEKAAKEFTDVKFVFIDGWPLGVDNVAGIAFKEEQCGYFAGYAVVKEGFEKLGFMGGGGGTNAACCRYGYGFVQGAAEGATGLPTATWSLKNYKVSEYEAQLKAVVDGTLKIDDAVIEAPNYPQSTDSCTVIYE